jgi:ubiquinone/menaquinone biosynthesis C-methylase UbiE
MVAEARKRAADPRLFVVRGVAERLPFADDAFDLVISTTSFDHWDDQDAGLRECARVLTTGGHFVLTDQFSAWLLPTLLMGRRDKARTRRRASARLARAGFHSLVWDDRVAMIMRTVTATV